MAQPRYALAPDVRLKFFDDEAVVFNPFTWETHVLNAAASLALEQVSARPCSCDDLERLLHEVLAEDEQPRAAEHARRLIGELAALRLIVPRPDDDARL